MDSAVLDQLVELAQAFNKIGLRPLIVGGLGSYLLFHDRSKAVRATSDIDLMIPHSQACEAAKRRAIAEVITGELQYVAREGGKHFRFTGKPNKQLDVLADIATQGERVKLVRSKLHGRLTPEACFIEEDMRSVDLTGLIPALPAASPLMVNVPSPTNMLILKLFAFDDRDSDAHRSRERAQAHAYDIYLIAELAQRDDYLEGRRFLDRHAQEEIVRKAQAIVQGKFQALDQSGWQLVLASDLLSSGRSITERRQALDSSRRRLVRWFGGPNLPWSK
jgi:hypothetical protein